MFEEISKSKSAIIDAAAKCFMEMGADVASIDDIAHSLGSTKGRIYYHFSTKGVLISAVRIRATMFTWDAVTQVMGTQESASENFRLMAYTHILTVLNSLPYHKVVVQRYGLQSAKSTTAYERELLTKIHASRRQYEDLFREVLQTGVQEQEFRQQNVSIALHSVLILLNSPIFWYRARDDDTKMTREEIAEQLSRMALASLK